MSQNFKQLSVKYRPKTTDDVLENDEAKDDVNNIIQKKDAHAILFFGESGCGKTTLAKVLASGLTKVSQDITQENIGSDKGVEKVREMIRASHFLPRGAFRVFILDEVHALNGYGQSAILTNIEEPVHDRIVWIMCTNKHHLLQGELLNRLYKIQVKKPSLEGLTKYIYKIAKTERLFDYDKEKVQRICKEIAMASDRVPREALQLLQSISNKKESFTSFKDLIIQGIRKRTEETIDKTALQIIMAMYSDKKSVEERASYLVSQLQDKDLWGLMERLVYIHYGLLTHMGGVKVPAVYYYAKELEPQNGMPPNLRVAAKMSEELMVIKNALPTINSSIQHFITPALVNLLYRVDGVLKKSRD